MALFGSGGFKAALVDPRSEEEKRRQLAAMLGATGSPALNPGQQSGLLTQSANHWDPNVPDFGVGDHPANPVQPQPALPAQQAKPAIDPELLKLIGQAPVKKKNTGRDIAAFALAAISDGLARHQGLKGTAGDALVKNWQDRRDTFKTQAEQYQDRMRVAQLPGMSVRELAAYMAAPKEWGGHMADAATSRYGAATLNPGDQRFLGDGNGAYQAPTRGQEYATAIGLQPGSEPYHNAIRDQELGANGPTGFSNQQNLAGLRYRNQSSLAAQRATQAAALQRQRLSGAMNLRGAPTYRDLNPPAPRMPGLRAPPRRMMPTATGPNGEKVQWNGRAWVPAQ